MLIIGCWHLKTLSWLGDKLSPSFDIGAHILVVRKTSYDGLTVFYGVAGGRW